MSELFKDQSLLTLSAPTGYNDLNSADEKKIRYRKPSGTVGFWNATVNGQSLVYNLTAGDIDEKGKWMFQAYILVGSLEGFGKLKTRYFQNHI